MTTRKIARPFGAQDIERDGPGGGRPDTLSIDAVASVAASRHAAGSTTISLKGGYEILGDIRPLAWTLPMSALYHLRPVRMRFKPETFTPIISCRE